MKERNVNQLEIEELEERIAPGLIGINPPGQVGPPPPGQIGQHGQPPPGHLGPPPPR